MIFNIVLALITFAASMILIHEVVSHTRKNKCKISFKESMDLTELPVVTFINNGKKVNFLLDSGSNTSFINESVIKELDCKILNVSSEMIGVEGKVTTNRICSMEISYKDKSFHSDFLINNMDDAFNRIKKESGVQIHGILGSLFFQKYRYVLDFASLIAYLK